MRCHFSGSSLQLERMFSEEQLAKVMSVITRPGW